MSSMRLSHAAFLDTARKHQHAFLLNRHQEKSRYEKRACLPLELAAKGHNFVNLPVVRSELTKHLKLKSDQEDLPDCALVRDMLRSQHIPFNLVMPLAGNAKAALFFEKILKLPVERVVTITVEFAPPAARKLLGDNTCFDAYAELEIKNKGVFAVGIEVKYTEGPYRWGHTEYKRMHAQESAYLAVTTQSELYLTGALERLRTKKQKQMWRNQLLGECILSADIETKDYRYILLYPGQSEYSFNLGSDYAKLLNDDKSERFAMISYEEWLDAAEQSIEKASDVDWVSYARERYLLTLE